MGEATHYMGKLKPLKGCDVIGDDPNRWGLVTDDGGPQFIVASIENGPPGHTMAGEGLLAERLAACWNDCLSIDDTSAVPEVFEACRRLTVLDVLINHFPMRPKTMTPQEWKEFQTVIDAIAKASSKATGK